MVTTLRTARPDPELFGGKGAALARLLSAGFPVPPGFVVTTDAYLAFVQLNDLGTWLDDLCRTEPPDAVQRAVRERFSDAQVPEPVAQSIRESYAAIRGPRVAVRSSANAEDLPDLSFAGQYESFLNVSGKADVLRRVVECWASLWTARAVAYRRSHELSHEAVSMAVVVQEMVPSEVAGVLFTANPVSGKRTEMVLEAVTGLGDALVLGQVEPARYVLDSKTGAVRERSGSTSGTLSRIDELARLGRDVAAFLDAPQDIEWAFAEGRFHLVQSRPITSLYRLPDGLSPDGPLLVFGSVGAIQGMLEPITPLGRDALYTVFAGGARLFGSTVNRESQRVLFTAGERLFVNATPILRHPVGRRALQEGLAMMEPGLATLVPKLVLDPRLRGRFRPPRILTLVGVLRFAAPYAFRVLLALARPAARRQAVARRVNMFLDSYASRFRAAHSLPERLTLADEALRETVPIIVRTYLPLFAAGMASFVLLRQLCGDEALRVTRGLPHNVTTEMGLELWDTAIAMKEHGRDGRLEPFLDKFGMRGVGEIDLGRPRWREDPRLLEPVIDSYFRIADQDRSPRAVFEQGARDAVAAIDEISVGWKGALVRLVAKRMRALAGHRESPKFLLIRVMGHVREALLESAKELTAASRLDRPEDLFFLTFSELSSDMDWRQCVGRRRRAYEREQHRHQIPRLLTSEGQAFYESGPDVSDEEGVLVGAPVSPGVAEGRVHVVLRPEGAELAPGDILVCPGTDPAWTPMFLTAAALVTEVGGMMTHGSVVAREYGIPAVVCVHEATKRLSTGQRVRVDGTLGRIVILEP